MAHLENWSITYGATTAYRAPEQTTQILQGIVTGHTKHNDGTTIITTRIRLINYAGKTAITKNTEYTLGHPDAKWLKWCDNNKIDRSHVA